MNSVWKHVSSKCRHEIEQKWKKCQAKFEHHSRLNHSFIDWCDFINIWLDFTTKNVVELILIPKLSFVSCILCFCYQNLHVDRCVHKNGVYFEHQWKHFVSQWCEIWPKIQLRIASFHNSKVMTPNPNLV